MCSLGWLLAFCFATVAALLAWRVWFGVDSEEDRDD